MIHVLHWYGFTRKSVVVKLFRVPYVKNRSTFVIVSRDVSTTRVYSCHFFLWDYWYDQKATNVLFFSLFFDESCFSLNLRQFFVLSQEVCHISVVTIVLVSSCCKSEFHASWAVSSVVTTHYDLCPRLETQLSLTFLTIISYDQYSVKTELIDNSDPFLLSRTYVKMIRSFCLSLSCKKDLDIMHWSISTSSVHYLRRFSSSLPQYCPIPWDLWERHTQRVTYNFFRLPAEESPSFCRKICHRSIRKLNCLDTSFHYDSGTSHYYSKSTWKWSDSWSCIDAHCFDEDTHFWLLIQKKNSRTTWCSIQLLCQIESFYSIELILRWRNLVDRFIIHLSMNMLELIRVFVQTYRWVHEKFLGKIWKYEMIKESTKIKVFLSAKIFD